LDIIIQGKAAIDLSYYNAVCVKACPSFGTESEADMPATLELNNMETSQYSGNYVFNPLVRPTDILKISLSNTKERSG
jgi:hypothetical protein